MRRPIFLSAANCMTRKAQVKQKNRYFKRRKLFNKNRTFKSSTWPMTRSIFLRATYKSYELGRHFSKEKTIYKNWTLKFPLDWRDVLYSKAHPINYDLWKHTMKEWAYMLWNQESVLLYSVFHITHVSNDTSFTLKRSFQTVWTRNAQEERRGQCNLKEGNYFTKTGLKSLHVTHYTFLFPLA